LNKGIGHNQFKASPLVGVPKDWKFDFLKNAINIEMGQSPSSNYYNQKKQGLPFFQGNADFGHISPNPTVWCTKPLKTAEKSSILISVRAPVGEINISNQKCCIGRGIAALTPKKQIERDFLFYLLKNYRKKLELLSSGSTFKAINKSDLEKISIPVPPLEEQKEIAKILSKVDEKLKILSEKKKHQLSLKQGLMNDLLTGKRRVKL